ncbi:MAG: RidA family protein [Betaproteobacteria bacterium]|nr:MAG: RidA family protein [Betaproteobacteria bacterium]
MSAEKRLKALGIELPQLSAPVANYVNAVRSGRLLFLSGKGPSAVDGLRPQGKVGREFTLEQGYRFARSTGLALLAVMQAELGSLDRVSRVVKVLGMVNAEPDFHDQPKVINGCSDLFVEVFGNAGRHARSAVGMGSLPNGIPVEIEAIVEVAPVAAKKKRRR